jgi:hypothetical protein
MPVCYTALDHVTVPPSPIIDRYIVSMLFGYANRRFLTYPWMRHDVSGFRQGLVNS